jgi:hypothetical protein
MPYQFNLTRKNAMKNFKNLFVSMLLVGGFLGLQACEDNDGPLENAAEEVEDAAEDAGDAIEDATD